MNLVLMALIWGISSFNYYLINFQLKYINGSIYLNTIISQISELVACLVSGFLYYKIGIKGTLCSMFAISTVGSILYSALDPVDNLSISLMTLSSKFGVSATFNVAYLANSQLFPTIFGSTCFGICNIFARVATIVAPELAEIHKPVPMIVFAVLSGVGALASLVLITTKSKAN